MPDGPLLSAVDVSVWPRPGAATSPERGYQYHSPRRRGGRDPVVPGWAYQWLTRLSWDRDSWTAPIDVRRVRPEEKPTAVAVEQLTALVGSRPAAQRGDVPLVVFDAGYDACGFTHALAGAPAAPLPNRRPQARDDAAATTAGGPVAVLVTANDSDPDDDPLTLTAVRAPRHGTAACAPVGPSAFCPPWRCVYAPAAGFVGPDDFAHAVADDAIALARFALTRS
jgi:hypothetical protein